MTAAPKRGGDAQQDKMKPSRLAPEGFEKNSNTCDPEHSALNAQNQEQPRATRMPPPNILMPARIRRRQITSLLWHRHHGPCRTDDAILYYEAIATQMVICCRPDTLRYAVDEWAGRYVPNLSADVIAEVMDRFRSYQRVSYRSEDLGRHLRLTYEEKVLLGITHIAAYDDDPVQAAERKKAAERERVNASRLASGKVKKPRSMSLARRMPRLPGENNVRFYQRAKALVAGGLA